MSRHHKNPTRLNVSEDDGEFEVEKKEFKKRKGAFLACAQFVNVLVRNRGCKR